MPVCGEIHQFCEICSSEQVSLDAEKLSFSGKAGQPSESDIGVGWRHFSWWVSCRGRRKSLRIYHGLFCCWALFIASLLNLNCDSFDGPIISHRASGDNQQIFKKIEVNFKVIWKHLALGLSFIFKPIIIDPIAYQWYFKCRPFFWGRNWSVWCLKSKCFCASKTKSRTAFSTTKATPWKPSWNPRLQLLRRNPSGVRKGGFFAHPSQSVVKIRNVEKIKNPGFWKLDGIFWRKMIVHHKVVVFLLCGCWHWQTLRFLYHQFMMVCSILFHFSRPFFSRVFQANRILLEERIWRTLDITQQEEASMGEGALSEME